MPESIERMVRFTVRVARRFVDVGCLTLAGSLTYTTLLGLVPLLAIALSLLTAFPVFEEMARGVEVFVERNMLPPAVAQTITGYMLEFAEKAAELTVVGLGALALSAVFVLATTESAFDRIWQTRRPRPLGIRALVYGALIVAGPVLIGLSLTITAVVVTASIGLVKGVPGADSLLLAFVPLALTAAAFTLLYLLLASRPVRLLHAAVGGVCAAAMFELMKRAFALYLTQVPGYTLVYGAFAAVPIFLVWLYMSWVVTLVGAVIAALLPEYNRCAPGGPGESAPFHAGLAMLSVLVAARPQAIGTPRLLRAAPMSAESARVVLDRLAALGVIERTAGGTWALACDPDAVTLADVFRGLVLDPAAGDPAAAPWYLALIGRAAASIEVALGAPLSSLAPSANGQAPVVVREPVSSRR